MDDISGIIHIVTDGDSRSQSPWGDANKVDVVVILGPMALLLLDS